MPPPYPASFLADANHRNRCVHRADGWCVGVVGCRCRTHGALALTRYLSSLLYSVKATDPLTFVSVAVALTGVALLACWLPARRASRVDPMEALRYE